MADEIKTILSADPTPALAALDRIRESVNGLESEYAQLNKAGDKLFTRAGQSTGEFVSEVQDLTNAMNQGQKAMQDLVKYEKFLEAQQKKTTDPVLIKKYADEIARTKLAMAELQKAGVGAWQKIGAEQDKASKKTAGAGIFDGLKGAIAGALPVLSLTAVAAGALKAASAYEQTRVSLETFLKSGEKADKLLSKLSTFSASTPFSADQVNNAAKALLAFGESENTVIDTLQQIGTVSAATGKDFNELVTIYGKARTAGTLYAEDINQLTEAGIPIIQEFAKQLGVSEGEVKKLASQGKIGFNELQVAFRNLTSEGGKFAGLLEKQSNTAAGVASTLADVFGQKLRKSVSGFLEILTAAGKALISFFDDTKSGSKVLEDERIAFLGVANQVRLTNEGTEARTKLINDLKQQYPEFLGQIDAEKVTNQDLQPILDKINQSYVIRIALQKQQEKLRPLLEAQAEAETRLAKEQTVVNTQLAKAAEVAGVNLAAYKTQEEQVNAVTEALKKQAVFTQGSGQFGSSIAVNDAARALQSLQASQIGVTVQTNGQAQAQERAKTAAEEQQAVAEQLKKTYGELYDIAVGIGKVPPPKIPPKDPPGTPDATELKKLQDAEKAREALRLAVLQDGRGKELAAEELRNKEQLAALNKYFKGRDELNGLLEQAEAQHRANVGEINKKYDAEEIQARAEAQAAQEQLRLSLIEDGTQKEIAAEKARFEKVRAELEKQFAGSAELPALLEQAQAQHLAKLNDINAAGLQAILETERQAGERSIDLNEENFKRIILLRQQRGDSDQDVAKAEKAFDLVIQQQRLENELKFQEALLQTVSAGDETQIAAINDTIAKIKAQIGNVGTELQGLGAKQGGGFKVPDLGELLGLDDKSVNAIKDAAGQVIEQVRAISAAKIAAAEEELSLANDKVKEAEDALAKEQELAEQGFANNVALRQQDLADAKAAQETALKEKKKAQKAALIIDTITQASSLITSAANIFNSLSALPFGAGVPIAIALIAAMFGSFIAAKAKAFSAVNASTFRQGGEAHVSGDGIVVGPSHEGGGVGIEVEGGEFMTSDGKRINIVRKHMTDKHFDLLTAINRDDTPRIAELAAQLGAGEGVQFKQDTGRTLERHYTERVVNRQALELDQLKESNRLLKENNRLLAEMAAPAEEITYFQGGRMVKRGNTTRIIRNGKNG